MHNMHGKKEFKLGTRSQVSIASSYIHEVHSNNCCGFLPDAVWLTTLSVNAMTHLMKMPCLISWNAMSHHVEMPCLVTWKNIFHGKLLHFTCKILRIATRVHTCRNEVVIEQYHTINLHPCNF